MFLQIFVTIVAPIFANFIPPNSLLFLSRFHANVPADSNKDNNDSTSQEQKAPLGQINLLEVEINDPNTALNVMVGFLGLAQKRGAFAINESAKIYECINKFS